MHTAPLTGEMPVLAGCLVLLGEAVGTNVVSDEGTAAENFTHVEQEVRLNTDDCYAAGLGGRDSAQVFQAVGESTEFGL